MCFLWGWAIHGLTNQNTFCQNILIPIRKEERRKEKGKRKKPKKWRDHEFDTKVKTPKLKMTNTLVEISKNYYQKLVTDNANELKSVGARTRTSLYLLPEIDGGHMIVIRGDPQNVQEAEKVLRELNEAHCGSTSIHSQMTHKSEVAGHREEHGKRARSRSRSRSPSPPNNRYSNRKNYRRDNSRSRSPSPPHYDSSRHYQNYSHRSHEEKRSEEASPRMLPLIGDVCVGSAFLEKGCRFGRSCRYYHEKDDDINDASMRHIFQETLYGS
jgi:hypothetical protein